MENKLITLDVFSLTKTEMNALSDDIADNAIKENKAAEMLWKLKIMEDIANDVKKKIYDSAVQQIQHMLGSITGTVTIGKCDINIQVPHDYSYRCDKLDELTAHIKTLEEHINNIKDIAKTTDTEVLHPTYGIIYPVIKTERFPRFVVRPHRI